MTNFWVEPEVYKEYNVSTFDEVLDFILFGLHDKWMDANDRVIELQKVHRQVEEELDLAERLDGDDIKFSPIVPKRRGFPNLFKKKKAREAVCVSTLDIKALGEETSVPEDPLLGIYKQICSSVPQLKDEMIMVPDSGREIYNPDRVSHVVSAMLHKPNKTFRLPDKKKAGELKSDFDVWRVPKIESQLRINLNKDQSKELIKALFYVKNHKGTLRELTMGYTFNYSAALSRMTLVENYWDTEKKVDSTTKRGLDLLSDLVLVYDCLHSSLDRVAAIEINMDVSSDDENCKKVFGKNVSSFILLPISGSLALGITVVDSYSRRDHFATGVTVIACLTAIGLGIYGLYRYFKNECPFERLLSLNVKGKFDCTNVAATYEYPRDVPFCKVKCDFCEKHKSKIGILAEKLRIDGIPNSMLSQLAVRLWVIQHSGTALDLEEVQTLISSHKTQSTASFISSLMSGKSRKQKNENSLASGKSRKQKNENTLASGMKGQDFFERRIAY
jgi:hypothetical protein